MFPLLRASVSRWSILILVSLVITDFASGSVQLPLEGYYRPGRFFPILLGATDDRASITFSADGCLPCHANARATARLVPMLATGIARELRWQGGTFRLRPLASDERLVASTSAQVDSDLFPGKKIIAVQLETADPLPGPPAAWESLDAIVLDSPLFLRISDAQRSVLLAGGVVLASHGEQPDHRWPWRREGSLWILSAPTGEHGGPAGPADELVEESVYAPTSAWAPGWSVQVRQQAVGIATLMMLIIVGILLIRRSPGGAIAAILVAVFIACGIAIWRQTLGVIDRAGGDIIITDGGLVQRDSWVYQRAKVSSIESVPWTGWTHPIFGSSTGMNSAAMQLNMADNGDLAFSYHAIAGKTMAFVRREILPDVSPTTMPGVQSPMREAAKAAYLQPGMRIVGECAGNPGRWPGVVISAEPNNNVGSPLSGSR